MVFTILHFSGTS